MNNEAIYHGDLPMAREKSPESGLQPEATILTSAPMSASRIHRYLAREVVVPMVLGILTFTFVLLMGRILKLVEMVINKGVPFGDILLLFVYLLPAFLVLTIPLAFFLGILLGFGRLSADSEIIALKASGVSLSGMMQPVLLLATLAALATAFLTLFAQPAGTTAFRNQVFEIAASRASIGLQPRVFNDEFDGLVIYTNDVEERSGLLEGIFIADERLGSTPSIILARHGRIIADQEALILTLRLEDGAIHRQPSEENRANYQIIRFATYDISLNLGQALTSSEDRPRKAKELTWSELRQAHRQAPPQLQSTYLAEIHKRLSLPFAPLIFALLGVPLGIQSQRSGRGGGFAIGLGVFLGYYLLYSFAETLTTEGGLPPFPTLWLPNLIFLVLGAVLFRRALLERPLPLSLSIDALLGRIRSRRKGGAE